jgi:alanyl-tRNA synthetase
VVNVLKSLVEEDIATQIETLPEDTANEVCNRIAKNFEMKDFGGGKEVPSNIRVVTVAGFPCPCGGTHVRSTGDLKVRKWGITGLKAKKGVVRVRYGQDV